MKKLTLEIAEKYATIITLTAIGNAPYEVSASAGAFDLSKTDKITIANDGKMIGTAKRCLRVILSLCTLTIQ